MALIVSLLQGLPLAALPFLLASFGVLYAERAGTLNVGVEGLMGAGAFAAIMVTGVTGNLFLGIVAAVATGSVLSSCIAVFRNRLGSDPFISGLALNFLVTGIVLFSMESWFGTKGIVRLDAFPAFAASGTTLDAVMPVFIASCLIACVVAWIALEKTPFGLRLKALGGSEVSLAVSGLNPKSHYLAAFSVSGALSGLAGAALSLPIAVYVPNSVAGRGWMSLALVYAGGKKPLGIACAAVAFALSSEAVVAWQNSLLLPAELTSLGPPLIALAVYAAGTKRARE